MGRGLRGSWSARSHPQRTWDSFMWASRGIAILLEVVSASKDKLGVVTDTSGRNMLEIAPSPGPKPRRRGMPKKKTREGEGDRPKDELSGCPTLEESIILTNRSDLVGANDKGGRRRKGRVEAPSASIENFSQQIEQAQFSIVELYQENRELQCQLAAKTQRIPPPQGCAGSTIWLQRQLREPQDTIMELREVQQMAATAEHKRPQSVKDNLRENQRIGDT